MPARDQLRDSTPGVRLGGAWMFIAGPRISRATAMVQSMVVEVGLAAPRHARAGLGAEVLDDDFLDVAVALVQVARCASSALDALGARLADADQDAGGERHAQLAGRRDRRQPHRRQLVGRAEMRRRPARTAARCRSPA